MPAVERLEVKIMKMYFSKAKREGHEIKVVKEAAEYSSLMAEGKTSGTDPLYLYISEGRVGDFNPIIHYLASEPEIFDYLKLRPDLLAQKPLLIE